MRDLDRWKDKVELQLDGRQIFFLFFGSAICACLIFVLGVVVGKRVEARTAAQTQASAEDPLAALDELGNAEEGLTFHSALLGDRREGQKGKAGKTAREAKEEARQEPRAEAAPAPRPAEPVRAEAAPAPRPAEVAQKPAEAARPAEAQRPAEAAKQDPKQDPKQEKKPTLVAAVGKPPTKDEAKGHKDKAEDKVDPKAKNHFTLQLSAFATKAEASDFTRRLREAGYKPYVIESMIPGKGLMYRVRLGDYTSRDTALSAKSDFERKQKMVAYVAKL